jgi:hypothetical protein
MKDLTQICALIQKGDENGIYESFST